MTDNATPPPLAPLYAALATARDKCGVAENDATHEYHKYRYASAEAIYGVARRALEGTGLTLLPLRSSLSVVGGGVSPEGEVIGGARILSRTLALVHSSGASLEIEACPWPVVMEKGRTLAVAVAMATTTQLNYAYRDLLLMVRGGDEEDGVDEPSRRPALAPRRGPAPAPRPAPSSSSAPSAAPTPAARDHGHAQAMRRPTAEELAAGAAKPPAERAGFVTGPGGPAKDSTLAAALPAGTQAERVAAVEPKITDGTHLVARGLPGAPKPVLEAPAATPAAAGGSAYSPLTPDEKKILGVVTPPAAASGGSSVPASVGGAAQTASATPEPAAPTPISDRMDEDERVANKLGDEHWELAQPLCDGDLDAPIDRDTAKAVLSGVAASRMGGLTQALALWNKMGVADPGKLPTRAKLRDFLLAVPSAGGA